MIKSFVAFLLLLLLGCSPEQNTIAPDAIVPDELEPNRVAITLEDLTKLQWGMSALEAIETIKVKPDGEAIPADELISDFKFDKVIYFSVIFFDNTCELSLYFESNELVEMCVSTPNWQSSSKHEYPEYNRLIEQLVTAYFEPTREEVKPDWERRLWYVDLSHTGEPRKIRENADTAIEVAKGLDRIEETPWVQLWFHPLENWVDEKEP